MGTIQKIEKQATRNTKRATELGERHDQACWNAHFRLPVALQATPLHAQIKGDTDDGCKTLLAIQSVTPSMPDLDPDLSGDIHLVFRSLHRQILDPNPAEYVWQWESGGSYSVGSSWGSTTTLVCVPEELAQRLRGGR